MERQEIRYEGEFSEVGHSQNTSLGKDLQGPAHLGLCDLLGQSRSHKEGDTAFTGLHAHGTRPHPSAFTPSRTASFPLRKSMHLTGWFGFFSFNFLLMCKGHSEKYSSPKLNRVSPNRYTEIISHHT